MSTDLMEPKRKGAAKKAAGAPPPRSIAFRVTAAYAAWLERAAKHDRTTNAGFLDRAAADRAKAIGFTEEAPERLP